MGKFAIRSIQQELLEVLKPKLKKFERASEEYTFVESMIKNLEKDLSDDRYAIKANVIRYDPNIAKKLEEFDLPEEQAKVYACLLLNDDSILVSEIAKAVDFDRGKTYRALRYLVEKKLVLEIQYSSLRYTVVNRKEPLKPLIDHHNSLIQKYQGFSLTN